MSVFLKGFGKKVRTQFSKRKIDNSHLLRSAEMEGIALKRLQLAAKIANIGIWDFLISENKLVWDESMFRLYGLDPGTGVSRELWLSMVHPDDRSDANIAGRAAFEAGRDYEMEFRIVRPDGSIRWLKALGQLFMDAEGNPCRVIGLNYDISDIKQTEGSLLQMKRLYATLTQVNQAIVRIHDRKVLFETICNRMVEFGKFGAAWIGVHNQATGEVAVEASLGRAKDAWPLPFINLKSGPLKDGLVATAIRTGKVVASENIRNDPRLKLVWEQMAHEEYTSFAAVPFRENGNVAGALCLLSRETGFFSHNEEIELLEELGVDISFALDLIQQEQIRKEEIANRKRVEDALRESEAKYRLISENAGDVIWVMDPESGRFTYVSPSVFKLRGYTHEEVMAQPVSESLTPESLQLVSNLLATNIEAFRQLESQTMTFTTRVNQPCRDGTVVPTEVTTTFLSNQQGRLEIIGVSRNIRERVRVEEEVHKLNAELEDRVAKRTAQLQEANRELEAFTYSVSHDLRAPLRAITGFSSILRQDYHELLDEEGNRLCGVIASSAVRLGRLIDDLLAFSRLSRSEVFPGIVDMESLAKSVFEELVKPEERSRIDFSVSELGDAPADPTMIKQVWVNLISNSVKYSSRKELALIRLSVSRNPDEVSYCISDNGIGFDMRYADKLFGVFQRLQSGHEFEGTGVGLAIVQRIILKHGGRVWAEGKPGQGAAFWFSLPVG